MKIALIGITGNVGTRLSAELINRGHQVTGIARNPDSLSSKEGLTLRKGDIQHDAELAAILAGHDAVIHSAPFINTNAQKVIDTTKSAGVPRLLVVGGAGSLEVAPGVTLVSTPEFPEIYKQEALAGLEFLNALRAEHDLNWTFLSPSAFFVPGERTNQFRLGTDQLLVAANGESKISMEDYSIALVDELEAPAHPKKRFTVGY